MWYVKKVKICFIKKLHSKKCICIYKKMFAKNGYAKIKICIQKKCVKNVCMESVCIYVYMRNTYNICVHEKYYSYNVL